MSNILVCNICTEIWGAEESTESNSLFIRHCAGRILRFKTIEDKYHHNSETQTNCSVDIYGERQDLKFLLYNCRNSFNVIHCVTAMLDWKDENNQSLENKLIL